MDIRPYLLPGLIFQSVVVGGGYATGRELVEFFMPSGPWVGILGLLTAGAVFALVMATAYEFARITQTRDYRLFCKALLGPGWIAYEIAYLALVVLILAVLGAAAGELLHSALNWPPMLGTSSMILLVALLTYAGSSLITKALSLWSVLLYLLYVVLLLKTFAEYRHEIDRVFSVEPSGPGWLSAGIRYASYNVSLPAVLFCMTLISTRRQALGAGVMTGVIAVLPALLFFIAMLSQYPQITTEPVPALYLMGQLNSPGLTGIFHLVVFGTFVETGTGLIHSINERIDSQAREQSTQLPRWARPGISCLLLLLSVYGATSVGIVDLIAQGYGILSWVFIAVLLISLLTIGLWRIAHQPP